jgi:hypothetical protein
LEKVFDKRRREGFFVFIPSVKWLGLVSLETDKRPVKLSIHFEDVSIALVENIVECFDLLQSFSHAFSNDFRFQPALSPCE